MEYTIEFEPSKKIIACIPLGAFFRYRGDLYVKGTSDSGQEEFRCINVGNGMAAGELIYLKPDREVVPLKQKNRLKFEPER